MVESRELSTFASYADYKAAFDAEVRRTETGFVRIGYMLRLAEDTDILRDSGYNNMEEFAEAEYRIDKSQASRFMNINRQFSEAGYSDRLQDRFSGYGVAKLAELLTLSDEVIESLPPELSRKKIQIVKKEIKEEEKISDLEVMMEGQDIAQEAMTDNLTRFMHQYIHDNPLMLKGLCMAAQASEEKCIEHIMDTLAPSGLGVHMARIRGTGKLMLSIKGKELPTELLNVRTNEKEKCEWNHLQAVIRRLIRSTEPETCWKELYGGEYPSAEDERAALKMKEAEEQKKAEEKQKEQEAKEREQARQAEERKARKDKEQKNREEKALEEEKTKVAPVQQEITEKTPEDPAFTKTNELSEPHQMQVEDYSEVLPDNYIKCHDGTEVTARPEETIWCQIRAQIEKLKTAAEEDLERLSQEEIIEMHKILQCIETDLERLMNP